MKPVTAVVARRANLTRAWLVTFVVMTSCDDSFSPLQYEQLPFSISGVLDAKADTQWIRVTAIRDSVGTSEGPIDARVILTDLTTNHTVELRDSSIRYASPDPDRVDNFHAHVFWTTHPIEAGRRYLLTATRSDGAQSAVVAQVPPEITSVSVDIRLSTARNVLSDIVEVEGPEHVALVYVLHYRVAPVFQNLTQNVRLSPTRNRRLVSRLNRGIDPDPMICTKGRLCDIRIISSGGEWPFNPGFTDDAILYGELGNIQNGAGFVDGINSIVVPYESCTREGLSGPNDRCRLTYDAESGWLTGRLFDPECEDQPIGGATITLRQVDGDRTRETRSELSGNFRMGALEPGSIYDMLIEAPDFAEVEERLTFGLADRKIREVGMTRTAGRCRPA